VKPVVGVTDLFSITATGVRNTATMFDPPDRGRARTVRTPLSGLHTADFRSPDTFLLTEFSSHIHPEKRLANSG